MLASNLNTEYVSHRASKRDQSMSPLCRTPPRFTSDALSYTTPLLTPSPFKRHPPPSADPMDTDDIFQSPYSASHPAPSFQANRVSRRKSRRSDPDEDLDLGWSLGPSSSAYSSTMAPPTCMPLRSSLRTPVKQTTPDRHALSVKHLNTPSETPAVGSKRKPNRATPVRQGYLTPLNITSAAAPAPSSVSFDRLAPLSAPRFGTRTPQTRAETEAHLRRGAETMTTLRISDARHSDDESGYESGLGGRDRRLFMSDNGLPLLAGKGKSKASGHRSPPYKPFSRKSDEVVAKVSPGGHITKRRARSRPVSAELLHKTQGGAAGTAQEHAAINDAPAASSVAFPAVMSKRDRRDSTSSSESEMGSPLFRPQRSSGGLLVVEPQLQPQPQRPMNRLASTSSASLFFGPSIPNSAPSSNKRPSPPASITRSSKVVRPNRHVDARPRMLNRHSYAEGTGARWARSSSDSSTLSSPPRKRPSGGEDTDDEFFGGPPETSFVLNVTGGTPSPKKKQRRDTPSPLMKKFRPRDSGIMLDESDSDVGLGAYGRDGMPRASTSVSTVNSDDSALITPGFAPGAGSGWPAAVVVSDEEGSFPRPQGVDAFILRVLSAGASKAAEEDGEPKRAPDTPVKKIKTAHLVQRPWQSAFTHKIGLPEWDAQAAAPRGKGRKSLPAAFPKLGAREKENKEETDEEEASPSMRKELAKLKEERYEGLGLGRPAAGVPPGLKGRQHWLMRRSSSGAFSSGSESTGSGAATPTRGKDWHLAPPKLAVRLSPLKHRADASDSQLNSACSSTTTLSLDSPTVAAAARRESGDLHQTPRPAAHSFIPRAVKSTVKVVNRGRPSLTSSEERPGRFEHDFEEIDELGSGQFGRVMKARYKDADDSAEVFAVKKSKTFEGAKHRLRLREEVDLLKHLVRSGGHPNVLQYIDSWEEEDVLFIQTELCGLGSFSHFLWAYGRAYPRLDEVRVWRVLAELSTGLDFIHESGVLHLDLKPANVLITSTGRLKIGDFGLAAKCTAVTGARGLEREGDKRYLAAEVLQGQYGRAADIFSLGMTMLETATNIVVPDQGDSWHRLRHEDFVQVDSELSMLSFALQDVLKSMLRTSPEQRVETAALANHPAVRCARSMMARERAKRGDTFEASALGPVQDGLLADIMAAGEWDVDAMDVGA